MSDKPKRMDFHAPEWHTRCLLELLSRLQARDVVLVAPDAAHPLVGPLMCLEPARFAQLLLQPLPAVIDQVQEQMALKAPFPDAGYRAALRAFAARPSH